MNIANNWNDYKILDMADGQKLEKWGDVILSRPDPQITSEKKFQHTKVLKTIPEIAQYYWAHA